MINKTSLAFVVCAALLSGGGAAFAADSGVYVGFGIGTARASFEGSGVAGGVPGTAVSNESSAFAGKVYGGYQFNRNIGVEISIADLGKTDLTVTSAGATTPGKATINGIGIAAVGSIPSEMGLALFGKLGGFYSALNASATLNIFNGGTTAGSREHRFVPNIGVGVTYDMTTKIGVRAEFERFLKVGSNTTTIETDVNMFTVGFAYKF